MKNTKLKDLNYEIPGTETNRPALELLKGIVDSFPFIDRCFSRHRLGIGKH